MLQPFELMRPIFVERLIPMKKVYLVSQTYRRGENPLEDNPRIPLLFTDYDDPGLAKIHLNALRNDKYAAIIDLTKPEHKKKILEMLSPTSAYRLYWSVMRSTEKIEAQIDQDYKSNVRRYVASRTAWQPSRDDSVATKMEVIFGELFITLRYRKEKVRITFEELETI